MSGYSALPKYMRTVRGKTRRRRALSAASAHLMLRNSQLSGCNTASETFSLD